MAFAPKGRESQRGNDTVGVPGKECSKRMKRDELSRLDRREYERLMDARRRRQKRYRRFRLFCTLLVMTLLCVTVIFVMTMFFKIQSILVTGVTKYTEAQIVVTSGIKLEENIFRIKTGEIEQRIWEAYPYV